MIGNNKQEQINDKLFDKIIEKNIERIIITPSGFVFSVKENNILRGQVSNLVETQINQLEKKKKLLELNKDKKNDFFKNIDEKETNKDLINKQELKKILIISQDFQKNYQDSFVNRKELEGNIFSYNDYKFLFSFFSLFLYEIDKIAIEIKKKNTCLKNNLSEYQLNSLCLKSKQRISEQQAIKIVECLIDKYSTIVWKTWKEEEDGKTSVSFFFNSETWQILSFPTSWLLEKYFEKKIVTYNCFSSYDNFEKEVPENEINSIKFDSSKKVVIFAINGNSYQSKSLISKIIKRVRNNYEKDLILFFLQPNQMKFGFYSSKEKTQQLFTGEKKEKCFFNVYNYDKYNAIPKHGQDTIVGIFGKLSSNFEEDSALLKVVDSLKKVRWNNERSEKTLDCISSDFFQNRNFSAAWIEPKNIEPKKQHEFIFDQCQLVFWESNINSIVEHLLSSGVKKENIFLLGAGWDGGMVVLTTAWNNENIKNAICMGGGLPDSFLIKNEMIQKPKCNRNKSCKFFLSGSCASANREKIPMDVIWSMHAAYELDNGKEQDSTNKQVMALIDVDSSAPYTSELAFQFLEKAGAITKEIKTLEENTSTHDFFFLFFFILPFSISFFIYFVYFFFNYLFEYVCKNDIILWW